MLRRVLKCLLQGENEEKTESDINSVKARNDVRILRNRYWLRLRFGPHSAKPWHYSVNNTTGRVETLELHHIRYIAPSLVRQLDQLEEIVVFCNKPPSQRNVISRVFEWQNLKVLHLHFLATEDVMRGISQLQHLHTLTLRCKNKFDSKTTPNLSNLQKLPRLRVLKLYGASRDQSGLFKLENLEELTLSHASVVPPAIGNLIRLRKLTIVDLTPDYRGQAWLPFELQLCGELRELRFIRCPHFVVIPFAVDRLKYLSSIEFSDCMPGWVLDFFCGFQKYQMSSIASLRSLKLNSMGRFWPQRGALAGVLSFIQTRCPNLEYLGLDGNEISSLFGFVLYFRHKRLRTLSLVDNPISDSFRPTDQQDLLVLLKDYPRLSIRLSSPGNDSTSLITPESQYYLDLNANGRHLLRDAHGENETILLSLWPYVLERTNRTIRENSFESEIAGSRRADVLYFILRNGPALAARSSWANCEGAPQ